METGLLREYVTRLLELHFDKEVKAAIKGLHQKRDGHTAKTKGGADADRVIDSFLEKKGRAGDARFEKEVVDFVKSVWPKIVAQSPDADTAEKNLARRLGEKYK